MSQTTSPLQQSVGKLWGVGSERVKQLARLDIVTVEDLLLHRPRRYEDRRNFRPIKELNLDEASLTRGTVVALGTNKYRKGTRSVFELILDDGTSRLHCRWWNLPFMEKYFAVGDEVVVYGKLNSLRPRTMDHPETEVIEGGEESFVHFNRIVPVYPLTEGLPQRWLRGLMWRTIEQFVQHICEPESPPIIGASEAAELSAEEKNLLGRLPSRAEAIRRLHFPETLGDSEIARQRLALEEFAELQVQIQARRKKFEAAARGLPCSGNNRLMKPFLAGLGFKLTDAQTRVLREIRKDLGAPHPMRRLLQGDVGSGKTAVAACTALMALESGFNAMLMAPTEILAEQHFRTFSNWFEPLGVRVQLQTGSRKTIKTDIESEKQLFDSSSNDHSAVRLVIGTHALVQEGFGVENLGLVIIDEQHKFGVTQREELVRKGRYPHLLVMTATPIPRTLGLTLYGDLDLSVIDELPAGRGEIKTLVRSSDRLPKVREFIRTRLAEGRQAYVVYPRVEDGGPGSLKAVTKEFAELQTQFAPYAVGLLHGKLSAREAAETMAAFRAGSIKVLLATSLIEVGVDVPNATVMLIENAEAFGLAQLHQLRGRVGRGAHQSFCILISDAKNPGSRERLKVLEETADGFRIAEADLKLRGPGELLGQQQSGMPRLRFGDLIEDLELIRVARTLASRFLKRK